MDYNWAKIFEDKSNKELYDIYTGNSMLPESTIPIAKKELENRNFDFEDMESNRAAWKLSNLIEEEEMYQSEVNGRKLTLIPLNLYLLSVTVIVLAFIFIFSKTSDSINIGLPIMLILATLFFFGNNYFYNKEQARIAKRHKEKDELVEKLNKKGLLKESSPIARDIIREHEKSNDTTRRLLIILTVISFITWIFRIIGHK